MNQAQLDRAVARATQESVGRIRNMGFSLMVMPPVTAHRPQNERKPAVIRNKSPQSNIANRRAV
jgi:hypothetical protein